MCGQSMIGVIGMMSITKSKTDIFVKMEVNAKKYLLSSIHPCFIIKQSSHFLYLIIFHFEGEITTTTTTSTSTTTSTTTSTSTSTTCTTSTKVGDCGAGWTPYKEKCYRLFPHSLPWKSASWQCEANCGHLASIPDRETERFLHSFVRKEKDLLDCGVWLSWSLWIGGYREDGDEEWQWHDGSPWNYTNWARGEPKNSEGRDHHLELIWPVSQSYWNDETEYGIWNGYICQNGGE